MGEGRTVCLEAGFLSALLSMGEQKHEGKTSLPFPGIGCDGRLPCKVKMNNCKYIHDNLN